MLTASATELTAFTTTTTAAFFARFGDVNRQRPATNGFAIDRVDRGLRLFRRAHGDEGEAARTAAYAIGHQVDFLHQAMGGKCVLKIVFGGFEGKISNEQFIIITHIL